MWEGKVKFPLRAKHNLIFLQLKIKKRSLSDEHFILNNPGLFFMSQAYIIHVPFDKKFVFVTYVTYIASDVQLKVSLCISIIFPSCVVFFKSFTQLSKKRL
jgi:hypothetical protein